MQAQYTASQSRVVFCSANKEVQDVMAWEMICFPPNFSLLQLDLDIYLLVYPICALLHPVDWQ